MSPKEKASELVRDMYFIDVLNQSEYGMEWSMAKQCALKAVDEILNEYPSQCPIDSYEMERHLFWVEVKTEIEKL